MPAACVDDCINTLPNQRASSTTTHLTPVVHTERTHYKTTTDKQNSSDLKEHKLLKLLTAQCSDKFASDVIDAQVI